MGETQEKIDSMVTDFEKKEKLLRDEIKQLEEKAALNLANVYYKTNLPLNKHFRHQKCLFRGRFVL